jgi:ATP adenylyltransferase
VRESEESPRILWAPWRAHYVKKRKKGGCVFCEAVQNLEDPESLVLRSEAGIFTMMNRFPYAHGHLLVSPVRHIPDLEGLSGDEELALMEEVRLATRVLSRVLEPQGFNIGINLGEVAGAGYAGHLHVHIVPRWNGDMNFMPILAEVRVISEHLEETYRRLKEGFASVQTEVMG